MMSRTCLLGLASSARARPSPSFQPLGFAQECFLLPLPVWPCVAQRATHPPQGLQQDTGPSPWAVLEGCNVCGCSRGTTHGPASPAPAPPSHSAWDSWAIAKGSIPAPALSCSVTLGRPLHPSEPQLPWRQNGAHNSFAELLRRWIKLMKF